MKTKQQIIDEAVNGFNELFTYKEKGMDKPTPEVCNGLRWGNVRAYLIDCIEQGVDAAIEAVRVEGRQDRGYQEIGDGYQVPDEETNGYNQAVAKQSKQIEKFTKER